MFEEQEQYKQFSSDLNRVTYYVMFSNTSNWELLDANKIYEGVCDEVDKVFKKAGVKYSRVQVDRLGGGGIDTIREIFMAFWENRGLLAFIVSIYKHVVSVYKSYVNSAVKNTRPRFEFCFWIESNSETSKMDSSSISYLISQKMAVLLLLADSTVGTIRGKYDYIRLDYSVGVRLDKRYYSSYFAVTDELRSNRLLDRYLYLIKNIKPIDNHFYRYYTSKLGYILKEDSRIGLNHGSCEVVSVKKWPIVG